MGEKECCERQNRALFSIIAINLDNDEIVYESKVIAEGEKEALFESDLKEKLAEKKLTRSDVHLIVKELGGVPGKMKAKKFEVIGQLGNIAAMKEVK